MPHTGSAGSSSAMARSAAVSEAAAHSVARSCRAAACSTGEGCCPAVAAATKRLSSPNTSSATAAGRLSSRSWSISVAHRCPHAAHSVSASCRAAAWISAVSAPVTGWSSRRRYTVSPCSALYTVDKFIKTAHPFGKIYCHCTTASGDCQSIAAKKKNRHIF